MTEKYALADPSTTFAGSFRDITPEFAWPVDKI